MVTFTLTPIEKPDDGKTPEMYCKNYTNIKNYCFNGLFEIRVDSFPL